ncbi:type III PLP-dependent enzyme [Streptomyces griseoviridis]|uniref:type III PLP-dependent enzyme n=1 Tax=Streptomyces griseoviridis TaxID=45398 RepID=UPI0033C32B91
MPVTDRTAHPAARLPDLTQLPVPAYVYDLAEVRAAHTALTEALPERAGLYYSLKANPHPALLRALRAGGARAEVCSTGELLAALDAGWPPDDLLVTGPGKSDGELRHALEHGVRHFSVDSAYALAQVDRAAGRTGASARCLLRINDDRPAAGQGLSMTGVASPFGVDTGAVLADPAAFADRPHARITGLHLYMGTNLSGVEALLAQFAHSLATARQVSDALAAHGVRADVWDLGGGFPAPFAAAGERADLTGLRAPLEELLDTAARGRPAGAPEVCFESGRYLVGTSGTLVTRVLDTKTSHGRDVVVLQSGIHHLGGMSGLRRLPPLVPHLVSADRPAAPATTESMVTGPLCTPLDTWAQRAALPALRPGDLVAVPNTGAYGLYASLVAFLGHDLPAEIVIDGDDPDSPPDITRLTLIRTPGAPGHPHR